MLARIADLRLCALMSLRPYVLVPYVLETLCPCVLLSATLCPAPLCRVSRRGVWRRNSQHLEALGTGGEPPSR